MGSTGDASGESSLALPHLRRLLVARSRLARHLHLGRQQAASWGGRGRPLHHHTA